MENRLADCRIQGNKGDYVELVFDMKGGAAASLLTLITSAHRSGAQDTGFVGKLVGWQRLARTATKHYFICRPVQIRVT